MAQNGSASFRIELRFIQRLTWTGDDYALRYEVIIEKEELLNQTGRGRYSRYFQGFTEDIFIEVSLPPGNYRFQVIPYDFFNSPVPGAQWVNFEVLSGGDKLAEGDHEVILINPGNETSRTEMIISIPGQPDIDVDNRQELPRDEIPEPQIQGQTAAQPETEPEIITITVTEAFNRFDIYLGAAYIPLLPLYNDNKFFFGENISYISAGLRAGVVSARRSFVSPGLELSVSWRIYESLQAITVDFYYISQMRIFNSSRSEASSGASNSVCAFNFRLGAGVSLLSDIPPVSTTGQYSLHANIGLSFLFLVTPRLYIEAGADYSQFFTLDHFGFFRPWIGIGARL
ncbi:MAG: hypothetical protein FWB83_09600 [Treponema sp.]|nr:hypothetical protein [Treponema sp.]